MASVTAKIVSSYTPPFASKAITTGISKTLSKGTTISSLATKTTAIIKSTTGTTTTTALIVNSSGGVDSTSLLNYFTTPYIDAHTLSLSSWRYGYIFWFVIAGSILIASIFIQFSNNGVVGNFWRKITMRRIVLGGGMRTVVKTDSKGRKKSMRKSICASPTFGSFLIIFSLIGLIVALSFAGDNYISPTTCVFGGTCPYPSSGPPKSSYKRSGIELITTSTKSNSTTPNKAKVAARGTLSTTSSTTTKAKTATGTNTSKSSVVAASSAATAATKRGVNNPNGWAPFNDPLLAGSNTNIPKNLWTTAARLGLISYAAIPLVVSLGLKQYPFNILSIPFLTNVHFDKTAILHRWSGRVVWLLASAHAGAWTYQLMKDKDPFGNPVFYDAWRYYRFVAGGVGWVVLTLLVILSFKPVRTKYYEAFYWSHIVLVIVLCGSCIIHSKPLAVFIFAALGLWAADKLTRFITLMWVNGVGHLPKSNGIDSRNTVPTFTLVKSEKVNQNYPSESKYPPHPSPRSQNQQLHPEQQQQQQRNKRESYYEYGPGQDSQYLQDNNYPSPRLNHARLSPPPPFRANERSNTPDLPFQVGYSDQSSSSSSCLPPAGYAYAQLLPGKTIRLTITTPQSIRWQPGQHLFLTIPFIALLQSHPYTITSVDERAHGIAPLGGTSISRKAGSHIVLLIRAQKGFSKKLWKSVIKQREKAERNGTSSEVLAKGVKLRSFVSWPLGSSAGTDWGSFETVVIICGGTGITFGISILEYLCRRMARQETSGTDKVEFKTKRVRCVWTIREYAHVSWVSPTLRRCLEMTRASNLQLDIYVSRDSKSSRSKPSNSNPYQSNSHSNLSPLEQPNPKFSRSDSQGYESDFSDSEGNLNGLPRASLDSNCESLDSITDMVLFEDDNDLNPTTAELELSSKVRRQGKIRRAKSRIDQGYTKKSKTSPKSNTVPTLQPVKKVDSPWKSRVDSRQDKHNSNPPSFLSEDPHPNSNDNNYNHNYNHNHNDNNRVYGNNHNDGSGSFVDLGDHQDQYHQQNQRNQNQNRTESGYPLGPTSSRKGLIREEKEKRRGSNHEIYDEEVYVDVTAEEQGDLDAVSELARPGYPKLEKILDEEIERSVGKVMVACCGPSALNTACRNLVSTKIDLTKIWKGDQSGNISLVCEDFAY